MSLAFAVTRHGGAVQTLVQPDIPGNDKDVLVKRHREVVVTCRRVGRIPTACQRALQSDSARTMGEQCDHCKNLDAEAAAPLFTWDFFTARHMLPLGFRQRFG